MSKVMLIDVAGVKRLGYVQDNVLPKLVEITIRRVQETMLRKVLGTEYYNELILDVSKSLPPTSPIVPLSEERIELLENYIHPYLAACVDLKIVYPISFQIKSKSVGKGQDENHQTSDANEMIKLKDQLRQDVDAYREILLEKIQELQGCEQTSKNVQTTPWNNIKFR